MNIFLDFESRSRADIWTVGAWEYARHPSTEVLCLAYAIDDGPVHIVPYGPASNTGWDLIVSRAEAEIKFAIEKGAVFHAHNAYFERCIWRHVLAPKYGLPQIPLKQWRCTAAKACAHGLPKSLEGAAAALGLPVRKDKLGRSVMLKLCKPNKDGGWNENVEDFRRLFDYCKRDVEVERAIDRAIPDLCPQEQTIWFLDQIINDTGIYCDIEAVDAARLARDRESERLRAALARHTGGALDGVSRRNAVLDWLKKQGVDLANLQKATVRDAIEKAPEHVKFVLAARQQLGLTSNAKYDTLRGSAGADNRLRDTLVFHSASTGRWGGKLVQLQNLPRGDEKDTDSLIELLKAGGLELFSLFCNTSPLNALSSCIRGMFTATPGCDLFVADFAAIEARVVMWLAGAENGLEMFRKQDADPTYPDIYVQMARRVLGRNDLTKADKTERQLGKQIVLACGYGMGHVKFQQTCATYGIECDEELAQKSVQMYRSTFDTVRKFWYAQEEAFRMCLTQGKTVTCGPVSYRKTGDWIYCRLPSGRELAYHKARVETDGRLSHMTTCTMTKKYVRRDTYGGKLTENITQAVARDLMAAAMLRLHKRGYRILLTVHDEIVAERAEGSGSIGEVIDLMTTVPDWAKGCPIAAEGWKGTRYKK